MIAVSVALPDHEALQVGLAVGLERAGIRAEVWTPAAPTPEVLVISDDVLGSIQQVLRTDERAPRIIVLLTEPTASTTRAALAAGASAVLPATVDIETVAAVARLIGGTTLGCVPSELLRDLIASLDEPPRDLSEQERSFLSLAIAFPIEQVGERVGLSRRQAQRQFRALCDEFGWSNHFEAAAAAARWGLPNGSQGLNPEL